MRAIFSAFVFTVLCFSISVFADDLAAAKSLYAKRDFTPSGLQTAQSSADMASKLVLIVGEGALTNEQKVEAFILEGEALFFVATGLTDLDAASKEAKEKHMSGFVAASQASSILMKKALGYELSQFTMATDIKKDEIKKLRKDLADPDKELLALALYQRAANQGAWLQLVQHELGMFDKKSVATEILKTLELMSALGKSTVYYYSVNRVKGQIMVKAKLAEALVLGLGSNYLADGISLLELAVQGTYDEGKKVSVFGSNNIYLIDALYENGQKQRAKDLLREFLVLITAQPNIIPDLVPENDRAKKQAEQRMAIW